MTLPILLPPTPPPAELAEAVTAVTAAPDRHELWDEAERLAADLQRPEDVALAYGDAIHGELLAEVALGLCERAVAFLGEWFEDGAAVNAVLNRAIAIDAGADWAFRRLTMAHTVERRWDELLALYDRVIAGTMAPARRAELYGEAAQIAKDLAGRADRAIEYLEALAKLSPGDGQITHSLERLLEREGRWGELVDLWRSHLGELDREAAQARRAQIAACLLDRLASPAEALDEAFHLLSDGEAASGAAAVAILERVFAFPGAVPAVRTRALGELRRHYAASGKTGEIIRVLGVALGTAEPEDRAALHREIAELLVGEGREAEALDHYAELLALDPESEAASQSLRDLGRRTGRLDRYAAALARAADACGDSAALAGRAVALLSDAARVRADEIDDPAGATALYERIFRTAGVDDAIMLEVCRRLDGLLPDEAQRPARLEVLERRALLEPAAADKRRLRGEAARLADALGDPDRALRSWELVLSDGPGDREAHEATITVLEREQRWEPLIAALVRSADAPGAGDAAREHRVRAAHVHADRLGAPDAAVAAWHEIEELFGQSEETIDALVALLGAASRWDELAAVLEHGLELTLDPVRRQSLLQQLGDLYRTHLAAPDRALVCYRAVLAEQPAHAGSRAGMAELLAEPACRVEATELLLQAFEETGDWEGRLSLLEHRLEAAKGARARTALLLEAADLHEERAGNAAAALRAVARALPLSPDDTAIEARLARLAEATSAWAAAAEALGLAVDACEPGPRAAELHFQRGAVLEERLADPAGALSAYLAALGFAEDRLDVAAAAVRAATRAGQWDVAARTVVASARARAASDPGILALVADAAAAADPSGWDSATASLAAAVDDSAALPAPLAGELLRTVAVWHRDRRGDPAAAEEVLLRALIRGGGGIDTLEMLAGVQRRAPGRPLVDTLLALADAGENALASLHEAARVAVDVLGDAVLSRSILERLLGEVSARLADGEIDGLAALASFAIVKLVRLAEAEGDHDRAVQILVDAAALPLGAEAARERLHEAATIAEELLGDADRAVALYRRALADSPGDARAIARLSAIFEAKGSIDDLLSLRRHELALAGEPAAKIALRLSIAALLGRAGDGDARLAVLRDNLSDEPGHAQSLEELATLLEAGARHADLCALLEEQAALLEDGGAASRAADLWTRASEIAEARLHDTGRALDDRRRAAAGRPTAETFDALARLSTARGDHAAAVGWLEKRLDVLDVAASADRIATVARLADALGGAGRAADARACLERGLAEAPGAEALRAPLRGLYRAAGAWDALVALLTSHGEAPPRADELREAADVCIKKLGSRERAIPILEAMVALTPADRPARMALAGALRGAGDLARAREILSGLLEEYGRRRPPERAEVHFQLAQVAAAAGQGAEAKAQLETATSMSTEHPGALRMLAGLYRDAGDLERAERMFGALLLIAVRQKPGTEEDLERPARSEVMINLYWILTKLGQQGRADEMLASAFEAARRSEFEARRLEAVLHDVADHALYLRALEERLAQGELRGPARAAVLSDMAEVLGGPLDRPEDAFRALLAALELDPGSAALRERAAGMARRAGAIGRWAEVLAGLAEQAETEGRTALAAGLFLALGEIQERDLGDAAQALAFYQRSERLGADPIPIWRAVARAAALIGDVGEQIRVLRQLTFTGDTADPASQTEDIYRLAELELGSPAELTAGLGSLEWALGREPRWDRAGRMLRAAAEAGGDAAVLSAYERVARSSGDPAMLLDALERTAAAGTAGMEVVREAVDLAAAAGDSARVDALLRRAVAIGEANTNGMVEAVWALIKLASAAEAAGSFGEALDHLGRAVEFAEPEEAARICRKAVEIAEGDLHSPARAAQVWESLLSRDRHDREVWTPLLGVYRRLGDEDVLEAKLRDAIECAFDAAWRADLRMERARLLEIKRPEDAAAELDDVLQENEENDEAAALLTRLYERQGREEDLASLLDRRLSFARGRDDAAAVLALSLRLGEIAARERPDQAIEVYRAALDTAPDSLDLLGRLLSLYGGDDRVEDRADVLERMLKLAKGREAAERALSLADLRAKLGDEDGAARALELGFRADPGVAAVRERLAALYSGAERWADLASMLEVEGQSLSGAASAARLREAAALYLDRLDLSVDAARALTLASERAPDDLALLVDLARCLARAGDPKAGRERVSAALERGVARPHDRVTLLRLRAELSPDEQDRALADLEAAYRIDRAGVARELADCLDRRRAGAGVADQGLLLRFVDLLLDLGEGERARDALGEWIKASPNDTLVLTRATELEAYSGRWESAVELCERLVELSRGPERVSAALLLAGACAQAGYPLDAARTVFEQIVSETPQDARIREQLRRIYEQTSAHRELASLYLTEARLSADPADRFAGLRKAGSLLLESAGDAAAAIAPLEAARDLRPRDNEVAMLLADAYIHAGKLQEAADFLDASIQGQKGRRTREVAMMQHRMAQIARAVGDRGNELAWLNAAFESDAQNGEAASALADVATEFGQLDVAVKALKAITLMKNPKPISRAMAYLRQAMIAQHQGDLRKANMLAKKAQSEDPSLEETQAFLASLSG